MSKKVFLKPTMGKIVFTDDIIATSTAPEGSTKIDNYQGDCGMLFCGSFGYDSTGFWWCKPFTIDAALCTEKGWFSGGYVVGN